MTQEEIREVVMKNIREVLCDLNDEELPADASLKDLGANSMDRADIVVQCLEDLRLDIPLVDLRGASNIAELVTLLHQKVEGQTADGVVAG